jgi:NAD(P)-dependent dehydrogenase (short-subunit alcohol dehydrogenase family)
MTSKWTDEDIPELTGKTAIVTGANSGIGYETARALAWKGATVLLACRNQEKGAAALRQMKSEYSKAKLELSLLDLANLASVHRFADEFTSRHDRLELLINNAGVMRPPFAKTADGFELQFGANHLGHFALTGLLLDCLIQTPQARVVTISSSGHRFGQINFDNLNAEQGYDPGQAYGQSKLANLLFTFELQRRFAAAGLEAVAVAAHPGWTATNLAIHWPMVQSLTPLIGQPPRMGALPTLYAATAPGVHGGDYYGPSGWLELRGYPAKVQSSAGSHDMAVAARLWTVSEELTGVKVHWPVGK